MLLAIAAALAVPDPVFCSPKLAVLPAFTLSEIPIGVVFAAAETLPAPDCRPGDTLSLRVHVADGAADRVLVTTRFDGRGALLQGAPNPALERFDTITVSVASDGSTEPPPDHTFVVSGELVAAPEGAPVLEFLDATGAFGGPVTLSGRLQPVEYPAGLSLVGLESDDGRLLLLGDDADFEVIDVDYADTCYAALQVFADGSSARGDVVCPEVGLPAECGCAAAGAPGSAGLLAVAALLSRRRVSPR